MNSTYIIIIYHPSVTNSFYGSWLFDFFCFLIGINRKFTGSFHTPWMLNSKKAYWVCSSVFQWFPGGASGKDPPANASDARYAGLIPALRRAPGEESGNVLQCSCLENPMDRWAWQATVHGAGKSQTQLSMSTRAHTHTHTHTHTLLFFAYPAQIIFHICAFSRHFIPGIHRWWFKWQFWHQVP